MLVSGGCWGVLERFLHVVYVSSTLSELAWYKMGVLKIQRVWDIVVKGASYPVFGFNFGIGPSSFQKSPLAISSTAEVFS